MKDMIRQKISNKGNQLLTNKFSLLNDEESAYIFKETNDYPECSFETRIKMFFLTPDGKWPKCQLPTCDNFAMIGKTKGFFICCGCSPRHIKIINTKKSATTQKLSGVHKNNNVVDQQEIKKRIAEMEVLGFVFAEEPTNTKDKWKFSCNDCGGVFERSYYNAKDSKFKGVCQKCANVYCHKPLLLKNNSNEIANRLKARGLTIIKKSENEYPIKQMDSIEVICDSCGLAFRRNRERLDQDGFYCPDCYSNNPRSKNEREIEAFINDLGVKTIANFRSWSNSVYEIDVFCQDLKIGFEHNGLYFHSYPRKTKRYHQEKMFAANEKGIHLIQIFEDEWLYKKEIVKSKIKAIIGTNEHIPLYARNCRIGIPTIDEQRNFLNKFHIQGFKPATEAYALYILDDPVAIMTFFGNKLDRFAASNKILGGFARLLNCFKGKGDITTFSDLRWSSQFSNIYLLNGFKAEGITDPGYFYIVNGKRVSRIRFQKHKLPLLFENVDMSKTEQDIMIENGIYPIYDAGHLRLTKTI